MTARYLVADVFDGLATLDDGSVDLVVTSPPFLALRSYLPADHPDKGKEIGSEPTPAAFLDVMLAVTAELRRVLAPHGSICVELGDTYASSGESGWHRTDPAKLSQLGMKSTMERPPVGGRDLSEGWPLAKSKTLIPELYRIALAYGINPLTGQESPAGRWRVRNNVTWCRPNPPVGALGDKWRPATSDVVVACTSDKRYWDDIATRRPFTGHGFTEGSERRSPDEDATRRNWSKGLQQRINTNSGAPLLDYWEIPPGGFKGSHYAVFPAALVEPLIKAMAPPKVCRVCGEPTRRIVGEPTYINPRSDKPAVLHFRQGERPTEGANQWGAVDGKDSVVRQVETLGWSDCGHEDWRPALVLDPFAGSGTTLSVATGHGHDALGIDLDERNRDLALDRIGPFLFEEMTL